MSKWKKRVWPINDFWFLVSQLWIMCDNSGQRIIFRTGKYSQQPTTWKKRSLL